MKILLVQQESIFKNRTKVDKYFSTFGYYDAMQSNLKQLWFSGEIYILNSNIREWLDSYNIDYEIMRLRKTHDLIEWKIEIPDEIAVLFKLTWL